MRQYAGRRSAKQSVPPAFQNLPRLLSGGRIRPPEVRDQIFSVGNFLHFVALEVHTVAGMFQCHIGAHNGSTRWWLRRPTISMMVWNKETIYDICEVSAAIFPVPICAGSRFSALFPLLCTSVRAGILCFHFPPSSDFVYSRLQLTPSSVSLMV